MVKIVYQIVGRNYQVPGLPYDDNFKYVRPVILDEIPTPVEIKNLLESSDSTTLTNPWPVSVIKGFREYIPTTFRRVTHEMPNTMMDKYFDLGPEWVPEADAVLLQLQTEIEAKAATIDAAIIHGRRERGTVVNKAHLLNRLYMIGRLYDQLKEREYPFLFGDLSEEKEWDTALSKMKQQFIEYLTEIPVGKREYPIRKRSVEVSKKDLEQRFPYVAWLKDTLKDDLVSILIYGSAARTQDPDKFSDYDNWVRVKDISRAHEILKGTKPSVADGKVITRIDSHHVPGAKHVGIHLFPDSEEYLNRHIRFLHDSREFLEHTLVIHGEFNFPIVSLDEVVERGVSQAYIKLKTIAGSLNWAYATPEKILGKPNLFEFIVKNIRFFLQHSLNATEEHKFRDKAELNELLADRGIFLPEYKPDLQHIQESLLYSMTTVLKLQKELIDSGRTPKLDFMLQNGHKHITVPESWAPLDEYVI